MIKRVRLSGAILAVLGLLFASNLHLHSQDLASVSNDYRSRLETNLIGNILAFWYPATIDRTNGGYLINHDIRGRLKGPGPKMIVTQARMVWMFSRARLAGYGGQNYLDAAEVGYRFLRDKMWDKKNGGFYWEVDAAGDRKLERKKHLYGEAFALYALSEYYLASGRNDVLEMATQLFDLLEQKAHDRKYGGYIESFNEDWTPQLPGEVSYMGPAEYKLMNTHLHLLEAMTCFYRVSKLPLARERLLELIAIQSNAVVRKNVGGCTDKYLRNWQPVLTEDFARVSYGHDLENIWLLDDACDAAGISTYPLLDLYRTLFDYSFKYGFDKQQGGFFEYGPFNKSATGPGKVWWVQAEALVSSLHMYRLTHETRYVEVFEKTCDWIEKHQVDWQHGEWFDTINPDGTASGDKAQIWKAGYHDARAMMECLEILKAGQ